ncbi:MAG: pyridoxal-phosphate dependent enzyme, partial [Candidatus Promineifilaceae bacterium]
VLRGRPAAGLNGNALLDDLLGAHLYWADGRPLAEMVNEVAAEVRALGRQPYVIPVGGSNVMGATGYVLAMEELAGQLAAERRNVDFVLFASSSGGTQAGLALGAVVTGFRGRLLGISIDRPAEELKTQVAALATATATHLSLGTIAFGGQIEVNDDYTGAGYGALNDSDREAIRLLAQLEGVLLDPVYTGRAMAGLIDLIRWGAFTRGQTILFWHTGGAPALFAYADQLG